jgi:hypothetical protein
LLIEVLVYDKLSGVKDHTPVGDLGIGRSIILKWMNWGLRV